MASVLLKRCTCCGKELPATSFYKKLDGLSGRCKECQLKIEAERYRRKSGTSKPYSPHPVMIPLDREEWKKICYKERFLWVSSKGRVGYERDDGKIYLYSQSLSRYGYKTVFKKNKIRVHRLVVTAFLGEIPQGMVVNHINGKKDDNRIENLEIVTNKENVSHAINVLGQKHRGLFVKRGKDNKYSKPVICYDLRGNFVSRFDSLSEASRHYNIRHGGIQQVCAGIRETFKGYIWRYEENVNSVTLKKDSKGPCFVLSHTRCNISECIFLTLDEIKMVKVLATHVLKDEL